MALLCEQMSISAGEILYSQSNYQTVKTLTTNIRSVLTSNL